MATARRDPRWLFGPVTDLLFGCGLAYSVLFLLQVFAGPRMREVFPLEYQPLLAVMLGMPHYGATLVRVYERREERRKYALFAVHTTIFLAAVFLVGLRVAAVGSVLVTIYFTWSPWHYSGQNYGIALMFLRRRGVSVTPAAKRLIYASFLLSFALIVLTLHGVDPTASYAPGSSAGTRYRFLPLGIPVGVANGLFAVCGVAYLASVAAAGLLLLRGASLRALGPAAAIVGTQALWFGAPALARQWGVLAGVDPSRPRSRRTRSSGSRRDTSSSISGSRATTRRPRRPRKPRRPPRTCASSPRPPSPESPSGWFPSCSSRPRVSASCRTTSVSGSSPRRW
jgi:hypothetical protein